MGLNHDPSQDQIYKPNITAILFIYGSNNNIKAFLLQVVPDFPHFIICFAKFKCLNSKTSSSGELLALPYFSNSNSDSLIGLRLVRVLSAQSAQHKTQLCFIHFSPFLQKSSTDSVLALSHYFSIINATVSTLLYTLPNVRVCSSSS